MIMRTPIQSSMFGYPLKNQKRKQQNLHMIQCSPRRRVLLLLSWRSTSSPPNQRDKFASAPVCIHIHRSTAAAFESKRNSKEISKIQSWTKVFCTYYYSLTTGAHNLESEDNFLFWGDPSGSIQLLFCSSTSLTYPSYIPTVCLLVLPTTKRQAYCV